MSNALDTINNLPDVSFIDDKSLDDVKNEMINDFESKYTEITGTSISLALADPNRLVLYACALQIYQIYQCVDKAGKMNLLKYATGYFLDYMAILKGLVRETAKYSTTTVRFTLSEIRGEAVGIASGTRVTNGQVYFQTMDYSEIPAGESYLDVEMRCMTAGIIGNDYLPGEINTLVDSVPYCESAVNITITSGGADIEDDYSLKERIYLSQSGYSVAGPDSAYEYWVKTFNTNVTNVKVDSPSDGIVDIRFMVDQRVPTIEEISNMENMMCDKKIRPLTDKVQISGPDVINYNIDLTYYINKSDSDKAVTIQKSINKAIEKYICWQKEKIGRDINPDNLKALIIQAGAKRAEIVSPIREVINNTQIAIVNTKDISYGGLEDD